MTSIITHRGLNHDSKNFYTESSYQAFKFFLDSGYGLEFDISFLADKKIVIFHDNNLSRLTNKTDNRDLTSIKHEEFKKISVDNCNFTDLTTLLQMIENSSANLHALHYKGKQQNKNNTEELIKAIKLSGIGQSKIMIFDLLPDTARQIREQLPDIALACSVSPDYDIKRFNKYVANTLLSIEQACSFQDLFSWAWLDEWDTLQEDGSYKYFYNNLTFSILRENGFKIALVSPELHATSPGLYAAESHPDAKTKESLFSRINQILSLEPDAICTDYPESLNRILQETSRK